MIKNIHLIIYFTIITIFIIILIFLLNIIHPIIILSLLIIYRLLIFINLSIWKKNFIYSILLFLIIISGLLIIFIYFARLISNEQINLSINLLMAYILFINLLFLILNINKFNYTTIYNYLSISKESTNINFINNIKFKNISILYEFPYNNVTLLSIIFLLITLFSIIKICSFLSFTLRKIN